MMTEQARNQMEAARARVEEIGSRLQEVTTEEQGLPARIGEARTSADVEKLSERRAALARLRGDLWTALESARRDARHAEEQYARLRIPEVVRARDEDLGLLAKHISVALAPLREGADRIAEYERELQTLNPPASVVRPDNPHLASTTHVLRTAFDKAVGIAPHVKLRAKMPFRDERVRAGGEKVQQGEILTVDHGLAAVLLRDAERLVEEVK